VSRRLDVAYQSRKTKETGEVDSDGEPLLLSDVEKEGDGGIGDEGAPEQNIRDLVTPKKRVRKVKREVNDETKEERPTTSSDKDEHVAVTEVKQENGPEAVVMAGTVDKVEDTPNPLVKKVRKSRAKKAVL
jgi:hypothetical protein